METPRESKRRKLDTSSKESPAPAPASRKRTTPKAPANGTPASRAKQARAGLSPYSQSKDDTQTRDGDETNTTSPAPQSALEKLRAKRQDEGAKSTPQKPATATPSKPSMATGFFKQFADPRLVSMRANKENRDQKEDTASEAASGTTEDGSDSGSPMGSVRASGRRKQLSTKLREQADEEETASRSSSAVGKKETFEDEIRELEQAARSEVNAKNADDATPGRRTTGRRPGSRMQTPKEASTGTPKETKTPGRTIPWATQAAAAESTPAKRPTPRKAVTSEKKARGRPRKRVEPDSIVIADEAVPEITIDGDAMEVDDSEDELAIGIDDTTPLAPLQLSSTATPQKSSARKTKKAAVQAADLASVEPEQLQLLQSMTLEKIYGKRPIPLKNLGDEYTKVDTVISQTITAGESNSMLLIGARGSGKTALVDQILREQAKEHPNDFHAVRLNGFVHTDDKIALREIWRQLGREMDLDEEENTVRNYADTLASLLALLSHPLELGQEHAPGQTNKSVMFILDEFELFASHPRQTLLYNLFDIAQSRKAPIAVLGLTTRIDVAESLEKRVKSRFSHRYVHLSSPKSFSAFLEICKAALEIHENSLGDGELETLGTSLDTWNAAIEGVLSSEAVSALLQRIYYTTKSARDLLAAFLVPLTTLSESTTTHAAIQDHLISTLGPRLCPPDSKISLLATLSTLQMALLICAARQTAIHSTETISFNLAFEEYKNLASKAKIQAAASGAMASGARLWSKDVAKDAWMDLIDIGLVMEDGYTGRGGGAAAGRVDVSLEEIGHSGIDLGSWGRWCKEI